MGGAEMLTLIIVSLLFIVNIIYCFKSRHKIKALLFSFFSGTAALIPTVFILNFFGFCANINIFTVYLSLSLGIPGVALFVATSLL
ncbi:MAG: pro-sigmaK processing inhibitor BofA family protein [Oscillospiraceae bacterium]